VTEVVKKLSHVAKVSSCGLHGGEDMGTQRRRLEGVVDVVVASPSRLLQHYDKQHVFFSQVSITLTHCSLIFASDLTLTCPLLTPLMTGDSCGD